MPISHRLPKVLLRALLSLSAIFALSISLLLTACGGSASSTPNAVGAAQGKWTWMGGSTTPNAQGTYGTQNTPSTTNMPGARNSAVSWTDSSGNFWLFGGMGIDSTGTGGSLNDLWEFNPTENTWMWVGGSSTANAVGVYGTLGVPSVKNIPGARDSAVSWTDHNGNFWLFGGEGMDSTGAGGDLNDLWEFNPTTKAWMWVGGSSVAANATAVYGTLGSASPNNVPGGRMGSVSWTDSSGNFWLFGGSGNSGGSAGGSGGIGGLGGGMLGSLNDLWEFNPTTKEWMWVSGSSTAANVPGVYGTLGSASPSNVPGGRTYSMSWADSSGNLWLFGGQPGLIGQDGDLNDLWEFTPATKEWTWISGSSTPGATGIYGTEGVPDASNVPGARQQSASWTDSSGNLWLFGGSGGLLNAQGNLNLTLTPNDLWKFNPTTKEWTWMSGANAVDMNTGSGLVSVYGTMGVAAATNIPGARSGSVSWIDSSGNLWLFSGGGFDDLWRYQP